MDLKLLLAGTAMLIIGYFLPRFNDWVYGKASREDGFDMLKNKEARIGRVICIMLGLTAILQFFGVLKIFK